MRHPLRTRPAGVSEHISFVVVRVGARTHQELRLSKPAPDAISCRATHKQDGATVALKKIPVDIMDERSRNKCLKEARLPPDPVDRGSATWYHRFVPHGSSLWRHPAPTSGALRTKSSGCGWTLARLFRGCRYKRSVQRRGCSWDSGSINTLSMP